MKLGFEISIEQRGRGAIVSFMFRGFRPLEEYIRREPMVVSRSRKRQMHEGSIYSGSTFFRLSDHEPFLRRNKSTRVRGKERTAVRKCSLFSPATRNGIRKSHSSATLRILDSILRETPAVSVETVQNRCFLKTKPIVHTLFSL